MLGVVVVFVEVLCCCGAFELGVAVLFVEVLWQEVSVMDQ